MKLSQRGEYALRALVALADSYDRDVVAMQVISEEQEIPKRFLEQILNDLRTGGFVESKRGIAGGYRLSRPMNEITVAEVVRQIEASLAPVTDLRQQRSRLKPAAAGAQLAIRTVLREVRDVIVRVLDNITIGDLSARSRAFQAQTTPVGDYMI